jgi:hypothetical protein
MRVYKASTEHSRMWLKRAEREVQEEVTGQVCE